MHLQTDAYSYFNFEILILSFSETAQKRAKCCVALESLKNGKTVVSTRKPLLVFFTSIDNSFVCTSRDIRDARGYVSPTCFLRLFTSHRRTQQVYGNRNSYSSFTPNSKFCILRANE